MSKRLQVVLDEAEFRDLQAVASREGVPLSEWVRRALREARRHEAHGDIDAKLSAVRAATRHEGPTADIDQMLAEIGLGYRAPPSVCS